MAKEIEIKGVELHKGIHVLTEGEVTLGYMVKDKSKALPVSIVLPNGTDLRDFDCPACAIKALYKSHHKLGDDALLFIPPTRSFQSLMLMAMLAAMADAE